MTLNRNEIDETKKWNTQHIFKSEKEWEVALKEAESFLDEMNKTKENITKSANDLMMHIRKSEQLEVLTSKIFGYSFLKEDEDTRDPKRQELGHKLARFSLNYSEFTSYVYSQLMKLNLDIFDGFTKDEPELEIYRTSFNRLFRYAPHTLSEQEEYILSQTGLLNHSDEIYGRFTDGDLTFPTIEDEDGNSQQLTEGNFVEFAESENRDVRKNAYESLLTTYKKFENTLSSTYNASLKSNFFYTKVQKYNSTLESSLFSDEVPVSVYHNLIDTVRKSIEPMNRYYRLKKEMLGLDDLHLYDLRVPMVKELNDKLSYDDAYDTILDGLSVLGEDYVANLKKARTGGWIDVYENEGKRSGAYSFGGLTDVHPYILLNHKENTNSMFTLAHELGHALHSQYSNQSNIPEYQNYTIFVAEVASTVNEILLMKHLLAQDNDKHTKMYLLNYFLEQFRSTLYRQTMFAEFERTVHDRTQKSEPLTSEVFNEIYGELLVDYNGSEITMDPYFSSEWSRIPHFYNSFYVYKYATGFSAANSIVKQILEEGEPAIKRYLNFLKSGSTKSPLELLKDAGVDMTTPQPIEDAISIFDGLITELENLRNE